MRVVGASGCFFESCFVSDYHHYGTVEVLA